MFYLAAAVSDFYIPASEMPEHKIQSSNGPLQVSREIRIQARVAIYKSVAHFGAARMPVSIATV